MCAQKWWWCRHYYILYLHTQRKSNEEANYIPSCSIKMFKVVREKLRVKISITYNLANMYDHMSVFLDHSLSRKSIKLKQQTPNKGMHTLTFSIFWYKACSFGNTSISCPWPRLHFKPLSHQTEDTTWKKQNVKTCTFQLLAFIAKWVFASVWQGV